MFNFFEESSLINSADALKGRKEPISLNQKHYINGRSLNGPWEDYDFCILGMGCFWGAERIFWNFWEKCSLKMIASERQWMS